MGTGYLRVETSTAFDALPVAGAYVTVTGSYEETLYQLTTDGSGATETVSLYAPAASHTLTPDDPGPFYATYSVEVLAAGYEPVVVRGVQIFDGETAILPVEMIPQTRGLETAREITIPPNDLVWPELWMQQGPEEFRSIARSQVLIPETVTVHLGTPSSNASNVRVPFTDYIKNVASSEIYPTWPQAALEANIYCQISFALNRVYTEWYPSRGYAFHITSSTAYDQSYVDGRNIFENISRIVDNIFNEFVQRQGYGEPYFTQYCNGTTVTCPGLSQWGTVPLANQGLDAYQILRRYYPSDIRLVTSNLIAGVAESYPGAPLRQGSSGDAVRRLQTNLNRIRINYPLIPEIANPNGVFGADTTAAVRTFQQIFSLAVDGVAGKATWYKVISIYNGVKRLAELDSEGDRIGIGANPPTSTLRQGSRGSDVLQLQFLLNYIGEFYSEIPTVLENASFDARTRQAVVAFQQRFGLSADGIVGPATWQALYNVYHSIEGAVTVPPEPGDNSQAYPGVLLKNGSRGDSVRLMQRYLNAIFRHCPGYVPLGEDGIFGSKTEEAVRSFQRMMGLSEDGIIGPLTWDSIVETYGDL